MRKRSSEKRIELKIRVKITPQGLIGRLSLNFWHHLLVQFNEYECFKDNLPMTDLSAWRDGIPSRTNRTVAWRTPLTSIARTSQCTAACCRWWLEYSHHWARGCALCFDQRNRRRSGRSDQGPLRLRRTRRVVSSLYKDPRKLEISNLLLIEDPDVDSRSKNW